MSDEDETVVMCARITTPLHIADNRIGKCAECGWRVQYRPHAPKGKKLCMQCALDLIDFKDPDVKVATTPRMVEDLLTYLKKKMQ